ncbi:protein kinase domain-containing protein [Actinomycetospora chiangmaiensis]|uniref:protein kinase domain-containing protein n=1 Tax=Actinomycetospora chiangmaiensis TaxID=402650 RepID=UPI0003799AF3|nr:protein kinase [Actinomycetospora chiangmaiensis]
MFGPYRVGPRLGRGGMGEVHEAFDTVRERTVALKRLLAGDQDDPDVRERFRRESRIAARLDSPHVVPIHDFGVIDGQMFIDMRLVRGQDLGALVKAEGRLPAERAVAIVEGVADALDSAHVAGLVHRDVKPSNVLLTARDFVYLADFGIVHVRAAATSPRLTATGSSLGTPSYMAPEQLRAEPFDQRLDVYALGCVLFEALVGRPPFVGERTAVMLSHLNDPPPRPSTLVPSVPGELDDVVLRALAKLPDDRFGSAGELAAAARAVVDRIGSVTEARTYEAVPERPAGTPPLRVSGPLLTPDVRRAPLTPPRRPLVVAPPVGHGPMPAPPPRVAPPARPRSDSLPETTGKRKVWAIGAVLAALVLIAGGALWYFVLRTPHVSAEAVAGQIVQQSGLAPGQVRCPDSLPATVGASVVCTATGSGGTQSLRATVTSVTGDQVRFDIVAQ